MKRGDTPTACPLFAESQKLDPAPGTLLNLSECEERLGKLTDAWRHIQQAIAQLPADDDRLPIARDQAVSLERRVPRLTVRLKPGAPPSSRVVLDTTERLTPGTAVVVDPGSHVIAVDAPGFVGSLITVRVAESERLQIEVAPDRKQVQALVPPAPATTASGRKTIGWLAGGVGVAGLGTALVTALVLNNKQTVVDRHCDPNRVCDQDGYDAARSGKRLEPLYWGAWIVGGAGIAVGTYLLTTSSSPTAPRVQLNAGTLPGGAGASISGGFW
jgi:hypothetical protein